MNYLQQLEALCEKNGLHVVCSGHGVAVLDNQGDGTVYLDRADVQHNTIAALAGTHDQLGTWPAVWLTSHATTPRTPNLLCPLPQYTGLVRVYTEGLPPATWLCKQGALAWQF